MRLLHRATDVSIRKYAEICGKLRKIYGGLQENTETRRIPVGQISYSSIGGVSLFNGIAQCPWEIGSATAERAGQGEVGGCTRRVQTA